MSNTTDATQQKGVGTTQNGNPMFYNDITVLNSKNHSDMKIAETHDHQFAKNANGIVLSASEFSIAASYYPIVFTKQANTIVSIAVTGYQAGENRFVGDDNMWKPNTYIPAYVRRYPFILATTPSSDQVALAYDASSSRINTREGQPLFVNGKPSEMASNAYQFCMNIKADLERTNTMLKELDELGILIERSANVRIGDEPPRQLTGFLIVDEQALNNLDDKKFLKIRKSGLLSLIYCHLWSMRSWDGLADNWQDKQG